MSKVTSENLFREQAILSLRRKQPGRPICQMPHPWFWFSAILICAVITIAAFLASVEYARKESVRGWLVARPGVIRVAHAFPSRVQTVTRAAGDKVQQGDPLIYLSADSTLSAGSSMNEELLEQLQLDLKELQMQLAMSRQRERVDGDSLADQLQDFDREMAGLSAQIKDQERRVELSRSKLQRLAAAAVKGAISDWDLLQQEQDVGAMKQQLSALRQQRSGQRRQREALSNRISSMPVSSKMERSSLRVQQSQISRRIAEYESRRLSVIESPVAGTVASIEVQAGNTAAAQQLLMTILPADFELIAEIYVPSRAAGFIQAGQEVRLTYDAFPKQEFGVFGGRIQHISEHVLLPADIPETVALREASFKAQVAVAETIIQTDLGKARLRPGMTLHAEVVLESRSLIDWLLEPLGFHNGPIA